MKDTNLPGNLFEKERKKLIVIYFLSISIFITVITLSLLFYSRFTDSFGRNITKEIRNAQSLYIESNFNPDILNAEEINLQKLISSQNEVKILFIIITGSLFSLMIALGYYLMNKSLVAIRSGILAQKTLTADISHELKTPLTIMKTNLEVKVRDKTLTDETIKMFYSNIEEVDKMTAMIDELLLLSRMDSDQEKLNIREENLLEMLKIALKRIGNYASLNKITFNLSFDSNISYLSQVDGEKIIRVFLNILRNAIDYSPKSKSIEISLTKDKKIILIRISDHGIGIEKENIPYLFDRFYRADSSRSKLVNGNGLGLPICKWIIEKHRGSINISSERQKGTTITILLNAV